MNTYYIFNIKEEFKDLYWDKNSSLYSILSSIKRLKYNEKNYAYTFLKQLTRKIEKNILDNYLYIKMHRFAFYSKKNGIHYYSDGALNEISNMEIKDCYIRLVTNKDISIFLRILSNYSSNFFICDFKHTRFSFIDNIKELV